MESRERYFTGTPQLDRILAQISDRLDIIEGLRIGENGYLITTDGLVSQTEIDDHPSATASGNGISVTTNQVITLSIGTGATQVAQGNHTHSGFLPTGGDAGQVLTKVDGTDFNADWEDIPEGCDFLVVQVFS